MPSEQSRRRFLCLVGGAVGVATAGCSSDGSGNHTGKQASQTTSGETTLSESKLDDETVRERVLEAENDHIREQLGDATCIDDWGTESYVVTPTAKINERTDQGVIVNVTQGLWYSQTSTEEGSNKTQVIEADGATEAQYLVTQETSERLSGDDVSPC